MAIVSICQEMKWTYQDFIEQPDWFISLIMIKFDMDSIRMKESLRMSNSKRR